MILFALGLIIGILVRDVKCHSVKSIEKLKERTKIEEKVEFYEAESLEEKWQKAKNIEDLL